MASLTTTLGSTAARGNTVDLSLPPIQERTLQNGMKIFFARRGPIPLLSIRLVIRGGSAGDPKGKTGLADFTTGLLRRGTKQRSAEELDEAIEFVGGSYGAGAGEDFLALSISAPAEAMAGMIDVLGELSRTPSFPAKEVEAARERTLAGIQNDLDDPSVLADKAAMRAMWGDHPYGHEVIGKEKDVATFKRDDVVKFHQARFGPKVAFLVVVGLADADDVFASAEKAFGAWKGGPEAAPEIPSFEGPLKSGKVVLVDKPDQTQSQVRIISRGYPVGHPDHFAAQVTNVTLGGGFTSRLMSEIRVKRGLTYGVGSGFESLGKGGLFSIGTFTKTESTKLILEVALKEVEKLAKSGPKKEELLAAQTYLAGQYPSRFETNDSVGQALVRLELYDLPREMVEKFRSKVHAVDLAQCKAAAKKYLFLAPPVIVVLGNAALVKPQLEGFGPIEVIKAADLE